MSGELKRVKVGFARVLFDGEARIPKNAIPVGYKEEVSGMTIIAFIVYAVEG